MNFGAGEADGDGDGAGDAPEVAGFIIGPGLAAAGEPDIIGIGEPDIIGIGEPDIIGVGVGDDWACAAWVAAAINVKLRSEKSIFKMFPSEDWSRSVLASAIHFGEDNRTAQRSRGSHKMIRKSSATQTSLD